MKCPRCSGSGEVMDAITYRQRIFDVGCPKCEAPPGTPCVATVTGRHSVKGGALIQFHKQRIAKAHPSATDRNARPK